MARAHAGHDLIRCLRCTRLGHFRYSYLSTIYFLFLGLGINAGFQLLIHHIDWDIRHGGQQYSESPYSLSQRYICNASPLSICQAKPATLVVLPISFVAQQLVHSIPDLSRYTFLYGLSSSKMASEIPNVKPPKGMPDEARRFSFYKDAEAKFKAPHWVEDEVKRLTLYKEAVAAIEFTKEELDNIMSELKSNPEEGEKDDRQAKLHRMLAHYIAPTVGSDFKIFNDSKIQRWQTAEIPDREKWHVMPAPAPSTPLRMIDVDTGDLVNTTSCGPLDQYCILSHTWKGDEITWDYLVKAKKSNFKSQSSEGDIEVAKDRSDIEAVSARSDKKAHKALERLQKCIATCRKPMDLKVPGLDFLENPSVDVVLQKYFQVQAAERDHARTSKEVQQVLDYYVSASWEASYYKSNWKSLGGKSSSHPDQHNTNEQDRNSLPRELKAVIDHLLSDAEQRQYAVSKDYDEAQGTLSECAAIKDFFRINRELVYAIEKLLRALYYRKSARKLQQTVNKAKGIFDECWSSKSGGRRYVWLDNCCIKKSDAGELTEALARMGEWYANAAFCLVHIDTPRSDTEWIQECNQILLPNGERPGDSAQSSVVKTYEGLWNKTKLKIEWATRGWTLQELVLSRVTYYFNENWEPLRRDVDAIGPYYYLVPFIEQYLRRPSTSPKVKGDVNLQDGIQKARELISKLGDIGLEVPMNLQKTTARGQIGRMVNLAAEKMAEDGRGALQTLCPHLDMSKVTARIDALNSVLGDIVAHLKPAIEADREHVRKIGRLSRLQNWWDGTDPVNSSARSIIAIASERNVTVPVDQVYSLMGILGVRFPVFPAEDIPKALCRLIDEVVVTSNDVSVFNWSGRYVGSPIRGRSLYPRSIEAFHQTDAAITEVRASIAQYLRGERLKRGRVTKSVLVRLRELMDTTTSIDRGCRILEKLQQLFECIKNAPFEAMVDCVNDMINIREELETNINREKANATRIKDLRQVQRDEQVEKVSARLRETVQEQGQKLKKVVPSSVMGIGRSMSKRLPRGILYDPYGGKNEASQDPSNPSSPSEKLEPVEWDGLRQSLEDFMKRLKQPKQEQQENHQNMQPAAEGKEPSQKPDRKMVCPNPIIVTSAGVRGVFDVQRVVVQMESPLTLRAKVHQAVDGEMIEGCCTISTGFSRVFVSFTCEKEILEEQLDITEVIERQLSKTRKGTGREKNAQSTQPGANDNPSPVKPNQEDTSDKAADDLEEWSTSEEPTRRHLYRMVQFVQEDNLRAIAGEWVLARFSDVEGADWFLCRFELGSGDEFYARRIATDAFTFENGIPEAGLIDIWQDYMAEQKRLMCSFLISSLKGKQHLHETDEALRKLEEKVDERWGEAFKNVREKDLPAKLVKELISKSTITEAGLLFNSIRPAIAGTPYLVFASYLQTKIHEDAIRKVPPILRGAVKAMGEERQRFPMMYHPSQNIHMF